MTDPPSPPSPPSGPPLGMYFSRRKETHPFPPSPAFTWMTGFIDEHGCWSKSGFKTVGHATIKPAAATDVSVSPKRLEAQTIRRPSFTSCTTAFHSCFNLPIKGAVCDGKSRADGNRTLL